MFITKRKHDKIVRDLNSQLTHTKEMLTTAVDEALEQQRTADRAVKDCQELNMKLQSTMNELATLKATYPFNRGDVLYQVQLRNEKGRFTKTKPSREHCLVIPVTVDSRNYFKLASEFGIEVFATEEKANTFLDGICEE